MTHFDKSLIKQLLAAMQPNNEYYTHHFEHIGCSSFNNDRPKLRQYLKHMESKGYIVNHKYPMNVQKWSITTDGIDVLELFKADSFI